MKKQFTLIVTAFLLFSCGLVKKIEKRAESEKTTEITKEKTTTISRDSIYKRLETLPTTNELKLEIDKLLSAPDFEQRVDAGGGNVSTITKKDGKLTVRSENSGSKETESATDNSKEESEKEFVYTSEYVLQETKKLIRRIPWYFWVIGIVFIFRKTIWAILVSFIPWLAFATPKK